LDRQNNTEGTITTPTTSDDKANGIHEDIKARRPVFLENRWQDLARLQIALEIRDYATIRVIAHNCKGTGNGYGFPEISVLGAAIGNAARASDVEALHECLKSFERCLIAAGSSALLRARDTAR
jgi:hypothetical protein